MLIWIRVKRLFGFIDALAPQIEPPVDEATFFLVHFCVLDDDCPRADSRLAPVYVREIEGKGDRPITYQWTTDMNVQSS